MHGIQDDSDSSGWYLDRRCMLHQLSPDRLQMCISSYIIVCSSVWRTHVWDLLCRPRQAASCRGHYVWVGMDVQHVLYIEVGGHYDMSVNQSIFRSVWNLAQIHLTRCCIMVVLYIDADCKENLGVTLWKNVADHEIIWSCEQGSPPYIGLTALYTCM